jgi:hypothetical protein
MIGLLTGAALAASPGGFRLEPGVPVHMVQVRQVVAVTPAHSAVAQTVLRGQIALGRVGLDVQVPYVHAWSPSGWSDDGLGQLRLGVRRWSVDRRRPLAFGVEIALPAAPRAFRVSAWGSAARETIPAAEGLVFIETAGAPDAPFVFRAAVGWFAGPFYDHGYVGFSPLLDVGAVKVVPVVGPLSVVGEAELLTDQTWLSARGLLRVDADERFSFDVGAQVPVSAFADPEEVVGPQMIAQARAFW